MMMMVRMTKSVHGDDLCSFSLLRSFCTARAALSNYYDVLGVKRTASQKEIKQAYFRLGQELHPDKHHASSNTGQADRVENKTIHSRFVAVNEAYAVLSKPETKRIYDLGLPSVDQEEQWRSRRAGNYQEMPDFHQRARAMGYGVNPAYYEKVSNADRFKILGFCASLVVLGYFIRHTIVEAAYNQNKRALQETNKAAMSALDESRTRAIELGSLKEQVEHFEKRYDMARADQKTATTPSMRAAQKTTTTTTTTPSMLPENGPAS